MDILTPPPIGTYVQPQPDLFFQPQEEGNEKRSYMIRLIKHRQRKLLVDAQRFFILMTKPAFQKALKDIIKRSGIQGITYQTNYLPDIYTIIHTPLQNMSKQELINTYYKRIHPFHFEAKYFGLSDEEYKNNLILYAQWYKVHKVQEIDLYKYILRKFKLIEVRYPHYWLETCMNYALKGYVFPINTSVRIDTDLTRKEYTSIVYLREPVDTHDLHDALLCDKYRNLNIKVSSDGKFAKRREYYDKIEQHFVTGGKGDIKDYNGVRDKGWAFENFNERVQIYSRYESLGEDIEQLIKTLDMSQLHFSDNVKSSRVKTRKYIQEHIIDKFDSVSSEHLFNK